MKILIALFSVFAIAKASVLFANSEWIQFKSEHGKAYATLEEETARYKIFLSNLQAIQAHNKEYENGQHSYEMGMNQFGDLTNEEFGAQMNGLRKPANNDESIKQYYVPASNDAPLPESIDWREKGYVTEVKDQKRCGS